MPMQMCYLFQWNIFATSYEIKDLLSELLRTITVRVKVVHFWFAAKINGLLHLFENLFHLIEMFKCIIHSHTLKSICRHKQHIVKNRYILWQKQRAFSVHGVLTIATRCVEQHAEYFFSFVCISALYLKAAQWITNWKQDPLAGRWAHQGCLSKSIPSGKCYLRANCNVVSGQRIGNRANMVSLGEKAAVHKWTIMIFVPTMKIDK